MLHGLIAESRRGAAVSRLTAVLKALAAELACVMLVDGKESIGELTVFEETVHVTIETMEDQVAVLLCSGNVLSSKGYM